MQDPLKLASEGHKKNTGGMNIPAMKSALMEVYPDNASKIRKMNRAELERLAADHFIHANAVLMNTTAPILTTPDELLMEYLLYLDPESLQNACISNRRFAEICRDDFFWKRKIEVDFGSARSEFKKTWKDIWIEKTLYPPTPTYTIIMEVDIVLTDDPYNKNFELTENEINTLNARIQTYNQLQQRTIGIKTTTRILDTENKKIIVTFETETAIISKRELLWEGLYIHDTNIISKIYYLPELSFNAPNVKFNLDLPNASFPTIISGKSGRLNIYRRQKIINLMRQYFGAGSSADIIPRLTYANIMIGLDRDISFYEKGQIIRKIANDAKADPNSPLHGYSFP